MFDLICEEILNEIGVARIFFLPIETKPSDMPFIGKDEHMKKFWHVGIIYKDKTYETFGKSKNYDVKNARNPETLEKLEKAQIEWFPINTRKLLWELNSGTDSATYVARTIGLDNTTYDDQKSEYSPDDIYEYVHMTNLNSKEEKTGIFKNLTFSWKKHNTKTFVTFFKDNNSYTYVNDDGNPDLNEAFFDKYKHKPGSLFNFVKGHPNIFNKKI